MKNIISTNDVTILEQENRANSLPKMKIKSTSKKMKLKRKKSLSHLSNSLNSSKYIFSKSQESKEYKSINMNEMS